MFSSSALRGCGDRPANALWVRRLFAVLCAWLACCLVPAAALAEPALDGYVLARKACPATPAIRSPDNPGGIRLEPGRTYRLLAENRAGGTHYLLVAPGASPERRWVEKGCGERVAAAVEPPPAGRASRESDSAAQPATRSRPAGRARTRAEAVIALSWQPAFCEGQPGRPECRTQEAERFDASNFSLHGLWPQPRGRDFCGVSQAVKDLDRDRAWGRLPEPALSDATRRALEKAMPGTQSSLDRHEWTRHGTCYGTDADEYFADALAVLGAVNGSAVRELFAANVGRSLARSSIRAAFDESFGAGAGARVRLACRRDGGRQIISEVTVGIVGEIRPGADIAALIRAAPETDGGCDEGVVDAVGRQ